MDPCELIGVLFLLCVVTFTLIGFWVVCAKFFKFALGFGQYPAPADPEHDQKLNDLRVTSRVLGQLYLEGGIDRPTYDRWWQQLAEQFKDLGEVVPARFVGSEKDSAEDGPLPATADAAPTMGTSARSPQKILVSRWSCPSCGQTSPQSVGACENCGVQRSASSAEEQASETADDLVEAEVLGETVAGAATTTPGLVPQASAAAPDPFDFEDETSVPVASPRQGLAEILSAFMLAKNIRWGEIISGLLIVGCVVGLVLSLREKLEDLIPYFANLVFLFSTAAVHGAGHYTLRKWKLQSTSRGVLTIGLLLVPLNLLAACLLTNPSETETLHFVIAMGVGVLAFSALTYYSCRALFEDCWWMPAVAILSGSFAQPLINRTIDDATWYSIQFLAFLPVGGFALGNAALFRYVLRKPAPPAHDAERQGLALGLGFFALATAIGLLLARSPDALETLPKISLTLPIFAGVVLAVGLLIQRRCVDDSLQSFRIMGTSFAIFGLCVGNIALALAWPHQGAAMLVALTNMIIFATAALRGGLGPHFIGAGVHLGVLTSVGCHGLMHGGELSSQRLNALWEVLSAGSTSLALTLAAVLAGTFALLIPRFSKGEITRQRYFAFVSVAMLSGVSILIALVSGVVEFVAPQGASLHVATLTLIFYVLAALLAGALAASRWILRGGAVLLLVTLIHALVLNEPLCNAVTKSAPDAWGAFILALGVHAGGGALAALVLWLVKRQPAGTPPQLNIARQELATASLVTSAASVLLAGWFYAGAWGELAFQACSFCGVWLVATLIHRRRTIFETFQVATFVATSLLATFVIVKNQGEEVGLLELCRREDFWPAQFLWLTACLCVWSLLRLWLPQRIAWARLLRSGSLSAHHCLTYLGVAAVVGGAILSALPGIRLEIQGDLQVDAVASLWDQQLGVSLWLPLGLVALALLVNQAYRHSLENLHGLLLLGAAAAVLLVLPAETTRATAAALRWSLSFYGILLALILSLEKWISPAWLRLRKMLHPAERGYPTGPTGASLNNLSLALTILPIVLIMTFKAVVAILQGLESGILETSWFHNTHMNAIPNYGVPLVLIITALLSHAIQRRASKYALGGSILLMYLVAGGFVLCMLSGDQDLINELVFVLQLGTIFAAVYGMIWLALHRRIQGEATSPPHADRRLLAHTVIPGAIVLFLGARAIVTLVLDPTMAPPVAISKIGSWLAYVSLLATLVFYVWFFSRCFRRYVAWLSAGGSVALWGTVVATDWSRTADGFAAFHFALLGSVGVVALAACLPWIVSRADQDLSNRQTQFRLSGILSVCLLGCTLFLSGLSTTNNPLSSPSFLTSEAAGIRVFVTLGLLLLLVSGLVYRFGIVLAYLGQVLIFITITFLAVWEDNVTDWLGPGGLESAVLRRIFHLGIGMSAVYGLFWLVMAIVRPWNLQSRLASRWPLYPRVAILGTMLVLLFSMGIEFLVHLFSIDGEVSPGLVDNMSGWLTLAVVGVLTLTSLWDAESRLRLLPLFCWGGMAAALPVLLFFEGNEVWSCSALVLATYLALWGWLWRNQFSVCRLASAVGIQDTTQVIQRNERWFVLLQMGLSVLLTLAQLFAVLALYESRNFRMVAGLVPLVTAISLVAVSTGTQIRGCRTLAVALFSIFGIFSSWADIDKGGDSELWLERCVNMMIVTALLTFFYSSVVPKFWKATAQWAGALRRGTQLVSMTALASLAVVLALEVQMFGSAAEDVLLSPVQIGAVAIGLVAMIAGLLIAALRPERDPFSLSLEGRQAYVYLAHVIAGLLIMHIRLTLPELFETDIIRRYWAYLLLLLAFAGAGLAEWFKRRQLGVLAEPFAVSGLLISLVPAGAMWFIPDGPERSVVLLTTGILHLAFGIVRGSWLWSLSAIVFGNLALWTFYGKYDDWSFGARPQFWLVPPAVSVLVALHLNRHRITHGQASMARYFCIAVIYISSTSEIFISGIGETVWPLIILATFALGGVFAGMALQVRAYLYLGVCFLFVSVLTMVMHAHRSFDHVWPWWAFGIGAGICILTMFGLFEKKRPELTAWITRVREWDG